MAIVRPTKLVLCADEITLQDERPKVLAVVRALTRGYTQAQLEPDEAVAAMDGQVPGLVARPAVNRAGRGRARRGRRARAYFGELSAGPGRDPTVAADARKR